MTVQDIAAEISLHLGQPTQQFVDREVGLASVSGWVWPHGGAPYGLRVERVGDRHAVRAWRHDLPGRRAELICNGAPTDAEVRAVVALAGLLEEEETGKPAPTMLRSRLVELLQQRRDNDVVAAVPDGTTSPVRLAIQSVGYDPLSDQICLHTEPWWAGP